MIQGIETREGAGGEVSFVDTKERREEEFLGGFR